MPSFLTRMQDKVQASLDKAGIDVKLHGTTHTSQAQQPLDEHGNPVAGAATVSDDLPDGKGGRPFIVESITHQLKTLHNQYAPQGPQEVRHLQVLITNAKGVALDYQGLGRDTKALSKDFYLWGQEEEADIKDVTDRLAYVNFVQGSLTTVLADRLDEARVPLKKLRESQAALSPRRAQRNSIEGQIRALQANPSAARAGGDARIKELQSTLKKHAEDDAPMEREVEELRRKAIRESEEIKWEAVREYAEKLLLLSQASGQILAQLPTAVPTTTNPYTGQARTAETRTTLQAALDNWRPGLTSITTSISPQEIDKRSFGESHATELSRVSSFGETAKSNPIPSHGGPTSPKPEQSPPASSALGRTGPVEGTAINIAPTLIDSLESAAIPVHAEFAPPTGLLTSVEGLHVTGAPLGPTVAETGNPILSTGPGPASGALSNEALHGTSDLPSGSLGHSYDQPPGSSTPGWGVGGFRSDVQPYESADQEKQRLERQERERFLQGNTASFGPGATGLIQGGKDEQPVPYESAEDEKKRLEREEREKLLHGERSPTSGHGDQPPREPPPSYT